MANEELDNSVDIFSGNRAGGAKLISHKLICMRTEKWPGQLHAIVALVHFSCAPGQPLGKW